MFTISSSTRLIIPDPNRLLIAEFRELWERDKTKDKKYALEDLSYVYYISDFKSPYINTYSPEKLPIVVKESFISKKNWEVDDSILAAIDKYKELQETKTIKLFKASEKAIDNLISYFENFDIDALEEDKVHDIAGKVMGNLQKVAPLAITIENARKKVELELSIKESSIRGKGSLKSREMPKNRRK